RTWSPRSSRTTSSTRRPPAAPPPPTARARGGRRCPSARAGPRAGRQARRGAGGPFLPGLLLLYEETAAPEGPGHGPRHGRPLGDNEADAARAPVDRVAQNADEGRDAGHRRDHEMDGKLLLEGEDALRPRTERDRVAHPQRPELRRELAVLHQLEEELEEGLVRGGDDRIRTLDAIEPDGAVLSRREGVGDLGLQANHRQIRREIAPLGRHRLRELGLRLQRADASLARASRRSTRRIARGLARGNAAGPRFRGTSASRTPRG